MPPDQYTFEDPRTRHPTIAPPVQQQNEPGLQHRMDPCPTWASTPTGAPGG